MLDLLGDWVSSNRLCSLSKALNLIPIQIMNPRETLYRPSQMSMRDLFVTMLMLVLATAVGLINLRCAGNQISMHLVSSVSSVLPSLSLWHSNTFAAFDVKELSTLLTTKVIG